MGISDNFIKIEKKFAWSFLGFLLAAIFGGFSIYTVYFMDTNPKIDFIYETNTNVFDIKENVKRLEVIYQGENIKLSNKSLSILRIKIINPSKVNILKTYFDSSDSLGFFFKNTEIVEKPEIVDASSEYLKHNLKYDIDSLGKIKFSPIILEGGEYFTLKLLVLHKQNVIPKLTPFGKIAGIKTLNVIETYNSTSDKDSFWSKLIQGSIWIHILRFIGYFITLIISILIIVIPSSLISDNISEGKRKRKIRNYKTKKKLEDTSERTLIYDWYLQRGQEHLNSIQKMTFDEKLLKIKLRSYLRHKEKERLIEEKMEIVDIRNEQNQQFSNRHRYYERNWQDRIAEELYEEKIIQFNQNEFSINKQFVTELNEFISYLKLV
jgi:hypothetical protein